MNRKLILKLIVIFLILVLINCIKTTTFAINVSHNTSYDSMITAVNNNQLYINYKSIAQNPYLFCREKDGPLPNRSEYYLFKKNTTLEYNNNAWAYLFAYGHGFGDSSKTTLSQNNMQNVFWEALNGQTDPKKVGINNWANKSNKEFKNASKYNGIGTALSQYDTQNKPKINFEEQSQGNDIGLFKIDYPYALLSDNTLIGGITQLYVYNQDENGKKSCVDYVLLDKNKNKITDTHGEDKNLTYNNYKNDIIKLNENMKNGFYVRVIDNKGFTSIKIKVKYDFIKTNVKFTYLTGTTPTKESCPCEDHRNCAVVEYKSNLYHENTQTYIYRAPYEYATQCPGTKIVDNKCRVFTGVRDSKLAYKCSNCGYIASIYSGSSQGVRCPSCHKTNILFTTVYKWYYQEYLSCNRCKVIGANNHLQNLMIVKANKETGSGWIESDETEIDLAAIKIKLKKYSEYKDGDTENELNGAIFSAIAIQDGEEIYNSEVTENTTIEVKPQNQSPIYITIKEERAPDGYTTIKEPINIYYSYSTTNNWNWSFAPRNLWNDQATDGQWEFCDEDGDWKNYPNIFKSKSDDVIIVDKENGFTGAVVKVYDNKAIKINVLKYDNSFENKLSGAEFKITAVQILNDNSINKLVENETMYNGTFEIVPISSENKIFVSIKETKAPNGYVEITKDINIMFIFQSNRWDPTYEPKETVWKDSGLEYSEWHYNENGDSNGTAFPNVYSTKQDDKIKVDKDNGNIYIMVGNKKSPMFEKVTLLKIDAEDETTKLNAKFNIKITNIESFEIFNNSGNREKVLDMDKNEYTGSVDVNGELNIYNVFFKPNSTATIEIQETEAPAGYYLPGKNEIIKIDLSCGDGVQIQEVNGCDAEVKKGNEENNYLDDLIIIISNKKIINLQGKVWLDGQTVTKPAVSPNGKYDSNEKPVSQVKVSLWNGNNQITRNVNNELFGEGGFIYTDTNGQYSFDKVEYGPNYSIKFEYDGINYIATSTETDSYATESDRNGFNSKYNTISNDLKVSDDPDDPNDKGKILEYETANGKSTLQTLSEINSAGKLYPCMNSQNTYLIMGKVQPRFTMTAITGTYNETNNNINLGLVKRGTDLALSVDVDHTEVSINGYNTNYIYNKENENNINPSYIQNIYNSDYVYQSADGQEDLEVYAVYKIKLQNQSAKAATINKISCKFNKLKYELLSKDLLNEKNDDITIDNLTKTLDRTANTTAQYNFLLNGATLGDGESKILYLVFKVKEDNNKINMGDFEVEAEIAKYSTEEGLIDCDSAPGNLNNVGFEDDSDKAKITIGTYKDNNGNEIKRKISGKIFEDKASFDGKYNDNEEKIEGVKVQLIELKNNVEKVVKEDTTNGEGYYEFIDFIPGEYIVRFIYGDGTSSNYKYNGQDYKSTVDAHYMSEYYNTCMTQYDAGASVARDNEARRLQTMAWSVKVDGEKGVLLKLLDVQDVDKLNETEKELVKHAYNNYIEDEIKKLSNNEEKRRMLAKQIDKTNNITNEKLIELLRNRTLANTYMQAETSNIVMPIDTNDLAQMIITIKNQDNSTQEVINPNTQVDGTNKNSYINNNNISQINLGLQRRPQTSIELKKYITGMKLVASNGQTLVNAKADVSSYFSGDRKISYEQISGIKDNLQVMDTYWAYTVNPTKVNTIVEGATLEFEYTVVVENQSEEDYLSKELIEKYNEGIDSYINYLENPNVSSSIGTYLGKNYYEGVINEQTDKLATLEVTQIRDYIDNNLVFSSAPNEEQVKQIQQTDSTKYTVLDTDYSLKKIKLNNVLDVLYPTGKMSQGTKTMYSISLKPTHVISTSGTKDFYNYIAEVMEYTNAAGRRADSTPANAEIVDHEYRTFEDENGETIELKHEKDEADTGKIQLGVSTGKDEKTPQLLAITIAVSVTIVGLGAIAIKKHVLK